MTASNDEEAFYGRIVGLDFLATLNEIAAELQRRPVPRYAEFLRGIRWLRQTGTLPSNFQTWQVQRLKVFAQELVQRGMKKRTLLIRVANRSLRLRFHLTEVAMRCELRRKILSAIDDLQHEPSLV